jgi:hypothetical protein
MVKKEVEQKSDVGLVVFEDDNYKELKTIIDLDENYNRITNNIKLQIGNIFSNYLRIGQYLIEANNSKIYDLKDFTSVIEYASVEFDLAETTTRNVMAVVEKYCEGSAYSIKLKDEYKDFSYSALVEMLPVENIDLEIYKPTLSVKKIREKKTIALIDEKFSKMFDEKGFISEAIKIIENYDYNEKLNTKDFSLKYKIIKNFSEKRFQIDFNLINAKTKDSIVFQMMYIYGHLKMEINKRFYLYEYINNLEDVNKFLDRMIELLIKKNIVTPENMTKKEFKEELKKEIVNERSSYDSLTDFYNPYKSHILLRIIDRFTDGFQSPLYYQTGKDDIKFYLEEEISDINQPVLQIKLSPNLLMIEDIKVMNGFANQVELDSLKEQFNTFIQYFATLLKFEESVEEDEEDEEQDDE